MRAVIILLLTIILSSCAINDKDPVDVPKIVNHEVLPMPVQPCDVTWYILEDEGRAMVALTWNDSLTLASCNKDIERYIKQTINVLCSYREELKEPLCKKEQNVK